MSDWKEADQRKLFQMIDALLAGELDSVQVNLLKDWIHSDEVARQRYVERLNLQATLYWRLAGGTALPPGISDDSDQPKSTATTPQTLNPDGASTTASSSRSVMLATRTRKALKFVRRPTPLSVLVAMIVTPLLLLGLFYFVAPRSLFFVEQADAPVTELTDVAVLSRTHNAQWSAGAVAPADGSMLSVGQPLHLVSGLAEIAFNSGARVVLQGPTRFTVQGPSQGHLDAGSLVANVPQRARGFVVGTPTTTIVDLGTTFRAQVTADGDSDVLVDVGVIELSTANDAANPTRLTAGQGVRVTRSGAIVPFGDRQKTVVQRLTSLSDQLPTSDRPLANGDFQRMNASWQRQGTMGAVRVPVRAFEGDCCVAMNSAETPPNGAMWQTIRTTPGAAYELTCHVSKMGRGPGSAQVGVEVFDGAGFDGAELLNENASVDTPGAEPLKYKAFTFRFHAASEQSTVRLSDRSSRGGHSFDTYLDDVGITQVAP